MPRRLWGCDLHIAGIHTRWTVLLEVMININDYRNTWRPYDHSPVWPLNCTIKGVTKNLNISHTDPWISSYIRLPLALVGHVRFLQLATYDFPQQTHGRICHKYGQQTLNANISSSSGAGVNVDYGFEWTEEIWNSMDADICNIRLRTGWQNAPYFAEYLSHMLSSSFNIARNNHI